MTGELYPAVTRDLTHMRRELAPDAAAAFNDFGKVAANDHPPHTLPPGEHHGESI